MEEHKINIAKELWEGFTWPVVAIFRFLNSIGVSMEIVLNALGSVLFIGLCVLFFRAATGKFRKRRSISPE